MRSTTEDLTQGSHTGDYADDPTRSPKIGGEGPNADPTRARGRETDPYSDPTQGSRIGPSSDEDPTHSRTSREPRDEDPTQPR